MKTLTARVWRNRIRAWVPGRREWLMPAVSLYWRRRRGVAPRGARRARGEARLSSPITFVSIHKHVQEGARLTRVSSASSSSTVNLQATTASNTLVHRITDRITRHRWLNARSLDAPRASAPSNPWAAAPAAITLAPSASRLPSPASHVKAPRDSRSVPEVQAATVSRSTLDQASTRRARRFRLEPAVLYWPARSMRSHRVPARQADAALARRVSTPLAQRARVLERSADAVRLEWRRPQPAAGGRPAAVTTPTALPGDRIAASPSRAAESPAPAAQPRQSLLRDAAPVLPLDASVIDRLADNVIQRIERRGRIERERRGL